MAKEHVVKSGDTLSAIAHNNKTDLKTLEQLNDIKDPNLIQVGQVIILPGVNYQEIVSTAKRSLETGTTWGTAWWSVKNAIPEADNLQIDRDLNKTFWAQPGAFEKFTAQKGEPQVSVIELPKEDIKTVQIIEPIIGEVKVVDPPRPREVKIVEPPLPIEVTIVEPPTVEPKVEIVTPEGKPAVKPEKVIEPEEEDKPLRAFFNKFIGEDKKFKPGGLKEFAQTIRDITTPVLKKIIPATKIADKFLFEQAPRIISAYKEDKMIIDRELLEQEKRRQEKPAKEITAVYDFNPFDSSYIDNFNLDLSKIDPGTFYPDNSNGMLTSMTTPSMILKDQTKSMKSAQSRSAELKRVVNDFNDSIFSLEDMRRDAELEISVVLTGGESEQEFQASLEEAFNKLTEDVYQKNNLTGMALAKEVNEHAKALSKSLQSIADTIQNDIEAILDFSFKDAPKDIVKKANEGFFDLIKDVDSYNTYVKSAKDFNDYNDVTANAIIDEAKAIEDFDKLDEELRILRTVSNDKFLQDNINIESLSDTEATAHVNYYYQNQKDIDRIYDISKEMSDVVSWMEINTLKAKNANDRSIAIARSIEKFSENFVDLVATKEFGDLISSYATEKDKDVSELIGYLNEYNRNKTWLEDNEDRVAAEVLSLETRQSKALLEIEAGADKINRFAADYTNELAKTQEKAKELERLQQLDDIAYNKMKSEVNGAINASRFLHPFKTWSLWKEHGAKEVIWEGVPKLITGMLETGLEASKTIGVYQAVDKVYGTENVMKDMQYWMTTIQENTIPTIVSALKDAMDVVQYVGGSIDSYATKMNGALTDKDTFLPFVDGKGIMQPSMMTKFSTWLLTYLDEADTQSEMFMDMKTKYDAQTITLPIDPGNEDRTYNINEIIKEYNSQALTTASGIAMTDKKLREEIIKINKFDEQGINMIRIPAGTDVIISIGNNKASDWMKNKEKERMWMSGEVAYDRFITSKKGDIFDFVKRENSNKVISVSMLNDFAGKGINIDDIPKGTELIIPKFDQTPSYLSWMPAEKRLKLQARNPFWNVFWNEMVANLGDPLNYVWPVAAFKFNSFIDYAGGKVSRELMKQARSKSPTGKISSTLAKGLGGMDNLNELASRAQSLADWTHGLTEVLRLKPVSNPKWSALPDNTPFVNLMKPDIWLDDPTSLATLSVLMTKLRGITISKMLPWEQKKLIDMTDIEINVEASRSVIDTKNAIFEISEASEISRKTVKEAMTLFVDNYTTDRNTVMKWANEYTVGYKNIKDWMDAKGGTAKNKSKKFRESVIADKESGLFKNNAEFEYAFTDPEDFYSDYYRRNKDIRVIDIAWEFMEKTGLSEGKLRELFESVPDVEKLMIDIEKQFIEYQENGRFMAIFHQEKYNSLPSAGKLAFRELLQDPETGLLIPNQATFNRVKADLIARYPSDKSAILRGIKAVEDYKDTIEWVRKYQEGYGNLPGRTNDEILLPVEKNTQVELRIVDVDTLPDNLKNTWGDERFKVAPDDSGKLVFIADRNKYKDGGLPYIMMDYGGVIPGEKLSALYNTPIGRSHLSLKKTSVDEGKIISEFVDMNKSGRPMSDKITYGDVLNTAFMDKQIGWFNNYFKDKAIGETFRSEFKKIMDKMVDNKREEFVSRTSVRKSVSERFDITGNNPGANKMFNIYDEIGTRVSEYLDIEKFYELVDKLKALYDADPTHSLYRQLYDRLFVLKRNVDNGISDFPLEPINEMILLLMGIKGKNARPDFLDSFTLIKVLLSGKSFSQAEMMSAVSKLKSASYNMINNKTNAKIDARSSGLSQVEIKTMRNEVRKKVSYWDGEDLSREEMAKKLKEELAAMNDHLPDANDKKFSSDELDKYAKLTEMDDFYYVGNVIPKFFTYLTLKKVGPEALLDNIIKFSKDINSKGVALVADIDGKGRPYLLQVVDDARDIAQKTRDNKILFPARPQPDSKIYTEAAENLAKNYGFKNDLVYRTKLSPDVKKLPELKDKLKKLESSRKILVDEARDNINIEITELIDEIKRIETGPDFLSEVLHEKYVAPGEDITFVFQDGTEKVIRNTEGRITSPHKLIRNEIESRAGFDKDSLYGHILRLKRKLSEGDKYVVLGEDLPEKFLNDVAAIDLALNLNDITSGKFRKQYFADRKSLNKLYDLEIDLANKEKAMTKQANFVQAMKDKLDQIKQTGAKEVKLTEQRSMIKKENIRLDSLRKEFDTAMERGNQLSGTLGVGKLSQDFSGAGKDKMLINRRYNKDFNNIDTKKYEAGVPVITKNVIDTLNQVKAKTLSDGSPNPNYGKTVVIADYTDYGKGIIDFLRDNPNHFVEGQDWVVRHVDDALDNKITTQQAIDVIQESDMKPILNMLNREYGLGIDKEDLLELMGLSFELSFPTTAVERSYKRSGYAAFDRLFPGEEKAQLERFANKLESIYRKKGSTDADKRRNDLWDTVATNKGEIKEVLGKADTFLETAQYQTGRRKVGTLADDFDIDDLDANDLDELLGDPERTYQTIEGQKNEYALSMAGLLHETQKALGWADLSPALDDGGKIIKGQWTVNSVRTTDALARVQAKGLQMTAGNYFDNGNLLPSAKNSLIKKTDIYDTNTQAFFELLPDIYGAKSARSYGEFARSYKANIGEVSKGIKLLAQKLSDKRKEHSAAMAAPKKLINKTSAVITKLRHEIGVERVIGKQRVPGYMPEIKTLLSKLDPTQTDSLRGMNLRDLGVVYNKLDSTKVKLTNEYKQARVLLDKARTLKDKLTDLENAEAKLRLDIQVKDIEASSVIKNIEFEIEKLNTEVSVSASIDNVLSGTYKSDGQGILEVKQFTKEFVDDINKRLNNINDEERFIRNKLSRVKKLDGKHPLLRKYLIELSDLKRESVQLQSLIKVAVPWNIAVANGIKFTAKEIYAASKGNYLPTYVSKMRELSKLLSRGKGGIESPTVLTAHKNLDVFFPTVKIGGTGPTYLKQLDSDWFKDWFFNLDRKHPAEVTLPRVDWLDLDGIDLSDSKLATENLIEFFEKTKGQAVYPTIVDLSGRLKNFIDLHLPDWKDKVFIINKDIFRSKLKSVIPGRGTHVSLGELAALKELKNLFEFRQGVWLFGDNINGVNSRNLAESFFNKALSKEEVAQLSIMREAHAQKVSKFLPTEEISSLPHVLPRSLKNESMKLIGADEKGIITKKTPRLNLDQIFNLSNRFAAQTNILKRLRQEGISFGEAYKKISKSLNLGGDVMVFGGHESLIDDLTREAIDDGIKLGMKFYFPQVMTQAEKAIFDYIKENKGIIGARKYDVSRNFKIGAKGNPDMVIFNNKKGLVNYIGRDKHVIYRKNIAKKFDKIGKDKTPLYSDDTITEFRSIKSLDREIESELSSGLNQWVKDENKLAPRFIKEESRFKYDIEEALSRWVLLKRKDKIRDDFKRISAENIKSFRNNMLEESRNYYGRELYKWEHDLIEDKVAKVKNITRLINDYVFRFEMPDKISNQIKSMIMDKVFYWSTLGANDPDSSRFKTNFYKELDDFIRVTSKTKDFTQRKLLSRLKSFWVWNVLLLRPSWYLWNNLGDSVRAVFGVRDIRLMKDLQLGYLSSSSKFINKLRKELTPQVLTKKKKGFRVFDLSKEPDVPFIGSKRTDEILNFNFDASGKAITKAGEVIDQETLQWITSSGLVQAVTDPIYARRLIESMPENTFWERTFKRSRVLKGDVEMFASQLEEIRRQTMAFDLLFNKAYTIAQTEKTVKRWLFDYRDITYAGRMMRTLFPFYTFHAKSLKLYFGLLAKAGPGVVQAGQALIEAMDKESEGMPSYMKDRIELDFLGLKGLYFLPHFGIADHFKMLLDPMKEFEEMTTNPLKAMFGLGFGPFPSSLIQEITGEGYFDRTHTTDQLRELGWSMAEIADYKAKSKGESTADSNKMLSWLITYSSAIFPYSEFIKKMFATEAKNTLRNTVWHQSPKVREIFKLFGINIKQLKENSLDEIAYVWNALNNLPPSLTDVYKKALEKENPELYKYFSDYAAMAWLRKINAMDDDELKYKEGITKIEAVTVRKYYNMEGEQSGSGDSWLANTPVAQDVMDRYWATKGDRESHEAGLRKFEAGKIKSLVNNILSSLGTASEEKITALNVLGIDHPFTKGLDKQKLYEDLYNMNGDLRVRSMEDLVAVLEKHGVIKELSEVEDTSKILSESYDEYKKLSVDAKNEQRLEDAKYYNIKAILAKAIPSNIDSMTDEEAKPYWDKWRDLKSVMIDSNPEYKKRYEEDTPAWQREYLAKNAEYISIWSDIHKDGEGENDFFDKFYSKPEWFQKLYFSRYPDKALYFPIISDYTDKIEKIIQKSEETGEFSAKDFSDALDFVWNHPNALNAWDRNNPGVKNYIDKMRQLWSSVASEDDADYFDLFYQKPSDKSWNEFREYYFNKPRNQHKKITYPFVRTWTSLIEKDEKNDTDFASQWFWSPNHAEARKLYGENNPIDVTHNKLDYQQQWKDWTGKIEEDPGQIYDLVLNAEPWFKNYYFKKHPSRAVYYPLASEMQAADDFAKGLEIFFDPKNKGAREAWDQDKPGVIAYNKFWKGYGNASKKSREAALDFYFLPENAESRAKHEKNNPGANEAFSLWREYSKMPVNTWEGRKARRKFLIENPELRQWWDKGKEMTIEEKEVTIKEEIYYTILDKVNADGKGRQYYLDYFGAKAEAKKYLDDNPDLDAARKERFEGFEPVDKTIQKLLEKYNMLTLQEDKNEFLKENKELDTYFFNTVPPGIRKMWLLQRSYFNLTDQNEDKQREIRKGFLELNPELLEYWDVSNLPSSSFTDKEMFSSYQTQFNKADDYFSAVKAGDWDQAEKVRTKLPETPPDNRTEEGRWLINKLYNEAMSAWASTFGSYMSTYYFRSLPSWLRNEYYRRHPDAKIISYTPMSRSLNNEVTIQNSKYPDLTWARRMMRQYGKDLPSGISKQVQKIMVKWREWDSRSNWSSTQWSEWWEQRTARLNRLRQSDLDHIPLLRNELARANKMFSYSMLPLGSRKHGVINPFLGSEVLLPELTIGHESDIIKNNKPKTNDYYR